MRRLGRRVWTGAVAIGLAGVFVFIFGGFHDLTAIRQHPGWVFQGIGVARDTLVALDADDIPVPAGFEPAADPQNVALYQKHCAQCHGAPGLPPAEFALGMMPAPSNLAGAAQRRPPEEVFWFIFYGLKMSGMPAWERRMSEADMWRITALVEAFPALSPTAYAALLEQAEGVRDAVTTVEAATPDRAAALGDPDRGRIAMQLYACRTCHLIPGLVGRQLIHVGPPLDAAGARRYIAGVLPNTPENMVRWLVDPQEIDPLSAMPDLGVSEEHARDMAAYLYEIAPLDRPKGPTAIGQDLSD